MANIRFLKKGIKYNGKYIPVFYSRGGVIGQPKETITIYARSYSKPLPMELKPQNQSEMQSDYFETDRARITPSNKYYKQVLRAMKK